MALFRKFFLKKTPDRLLNISERVYVFDCCFSTDSMGEDEYRDYLSGIVAQLQDFFPDASFMVFNFWSGDKRSRISDILSEYDMTVMDYPQQYEGCPLLQLEMIHQFLKLCEIWLSVEGQHNMLLLHCERGGWPVLAFMLAGLLLYRKTYTGEQKTLEMVYKQASRDFIQQFFPLNPQPSHLRYLRYITRQRNSLEWPPISQVLILDSVIIRGVPRFDARGGCRPYLRVHGQDSSPGNKSAKVLFEMPNTEKHLRRYGQEEGLIKINASCRVQGDVVLECIHIGDNLEHKDTMFRVMFNTAFIRSNILMLNRHQIDVSWNVNNQFPMDFRTEVLFLDPMGGNEFYEAENWHDIQTDYSLSSQSTDPSISLAYRETETCKEDSINEYSDGSEIPVEDNWSEVTDRNQVGKEDRPKGNSDAALNGAGIGAVIRKLQVNHPNSEQQARFSSGKKTPKMDDESSRHDKLEVVLHDQSAEPCDLRLQYLMDITDNFSGERELGRGGFGVVYKGTLPKGAMIAVKNLVSTIDVQDKEFQNEVSNLMKVRHQNIVRFVGYCCETWTKCIEYNGKHIFAETLQRLLCFEYMPCGSLEGYISDESHGLDWDKRYKIIEGICCGLNYLHEECQINGSIIHLDLKPANILLDENMVPKIADFGLSRLFNDQKSRTCVAHPTGSFLYMAPEYQHQGIITTKADIYSLGVIIIEIVAGRKIIPRAYASEKSFDDSVQLVFINWRNRLEASPSCTSLEIYYKQIKNCLEIGLSCVNVDPGERPSIREIIDRLHQLRTHFYVRNAKNTPANQVMHKRSGEHVSS